MVGKESVITKAVGATCSLLKEQLTVEGWSGFLDGVPAS